MKKILLILAALFFIGALVYANVVIFSNEDTEEVKKAVQEDALTSQLKDPMADPDRDGLANWEEDLYGTSKKKSDSDGDGVSDGVEVATGKDPLAFIDTPDDTIFIEEDVAQYQFAQNNPGGSADDLLARLQTIGQDASGQIEKENISTNQIVEPSGVQKQCINNFAIIVDNALVTSQQDILVLQNYITGSSTNILPVNNLISANKNAEVLMREYNKDINCKFISKYTIQMINTYKQIGDSLEQIVAQGEITEQYDYSVWNTYSEAATGWILVMNEMKVVISGLGFSFGADEPGSIFTSQI